MFGKKRREEELAAEVRREQADAILATETDDTFVDADESLEVDEEP